MEPRTITGRFQPLSTAAEAAIREALAAHGEAIVAIAGANRPRSVNDPFTYGERVAMLAAAFPGEFRDGRVRALPLGDCGYDEALREQAAEALGPAITVEAAADAPSMRADALHSLFMAPSQADVSARVAGWLDGFSLTAARTALEDELDTIFEVRRLYGPGPHLTADSICTWRGEVLLIERGNAPYKGTLAIPGGIVDKDEDPLEAAARELSEETRISGTHGPMNAQAIKGFAVSEDPAVYADEGRDPRGRYVGHAFHFDFSSLPERPGVRPGDDARKAVWRPETSLDPQGLAFDHFALLHDLIALPYPKPCLAEADEARLPGRP